MTEQPIGGPNGLVQVEDAVLSVRDLYVRAGSVELVRAVSFDIARRERVGLIGASGSGKTLTCMAVAGLLPDTLTTTGSVTLTGGDVNLLTASEKNLAAVRGLRTGMVFQEPMTALNPTMKVGRQVAEVMIRHRTRHSRKAAAEAAVELLAAADLPDPERLAQAYPHQLSGGQRQRVVLAIAIANNPDLLICDEPTTALDVTVQATVLELIQRRAAEVESALLFVTHDLAVVAAVCDRILVMYDGQVVEQGPVVEILGNPQHEHTRRLLADADLSNTDGPGER